MSPGAPNIAVLEALPQGQFLTATLATGTFRRYNTIIDRRSQCVKDFSICGQPWLYRVH